MPIPVAIAYSPKTQTSGITLIGATTIVIDDTINEGIESFPVASVEAPGVAVMCTYEGFASEDPADYETVTYTERHVGSNELRGVTREVEGTARQWPDETWIASYMSAAAWNEMRSNVVGHIAAGEIHMPIYLDDDPTPAEYADDDIVLKYELLGDGLNSDGYYTKWADGTLICHATVTTTYLANTSLSTSWTYPQSFISVPQVFATIMLTGATLSPPSEQVHTQILSPSTTACTVRVRATAGGFTSGNDCDLNVMAIGRWK